MIASILAAVVIALALTVRIRANGDPPDVWFITSAALIAAVTVALGVAILTEALR